MTSVPKPLKFLRPHFAQLQDLHKSWPDSDDKVRRRVIPLCVHPLNPRFALKESLRRYPIRSRYDLL